MRSLLRRMPRPLVYVAGGLLAGAFSCCALLSLLLFIAPSSRPLSSEAQQPAQQVALNVTTITPSAKPTSLPSPTIANTVTAIATATTAPTSTPQSSPTVEASPTIAPTTRTLDDPAVKLYFALMGPQVTEIGEKLGSIGQLSKTPFLGNAWTIAIVKQVVRIRLAHEAITKMTPPDKLRPLHEAIVSSTSDCNQAMDFIISGIDNKSAGDFNQAAALIGSCNEKMNMAQVKMNELKN